jgi:Ca-activated chloride channel homolog
MIMKIGLELALSDAHVDPNQSSSQRQVAISVVALPDRAVSPVASGINPVGLTRSLPLNLCLVLDQSGSMRGRAITTIKQAAIELIQKLQPNDRIAVIAFDHEAKILVPNQTVDHPAWVIQQLEKLSATGGTNIDDGLKAGITELAKGKKDTVSQLLLLTDGENEHGNNDRCLKLAELAVSYNMTLHTLGFGDNWNQNILERIADVGGGALRHIQAPDQASQAFDQLLNRVQSVGLTNAYLELELLNGSRLAELKPVAQVVPDVIEIPVMQEGDTAIVRLGDIMVNTPRVILANLYLPQMAEGVAEIARIQVRYDDPASGQINVFGDAITLPIVSSPNYLPIANPIVQPHILALAKYRQTQIAEQKLSQGDRVGAVTMLQTAAQTALQLGDEQAATVLQGNATRLQTQTSLSEADLKTTRIVSKTVLQKSQS